jgi:hypothetical protein
MGSMKYLENLVDQRLLDLHTSYIGKVLSVSGSTAKIQPLGMVKQYGEKAKSQAVVSNVPIAQSARYKITPKKVTIEDGVYTLAEFTPIAAGNIVICVCCERDITEAKRGVNSVPPVGHHSLSDSVVVGIL